MIYADPPWRYDAHSETPSREIENQYPTMDLDEICALSVSDLAADDAILFLWVTPSKSEEAHRPVPPAQKRGLTGWRPPAITPSWHFSSARLLPFVQTGDLLSQQ